ncbi:hypothetical protein [Thermoflexus sp.]|uniref:hypothetical protein n=1 Tax=Thermoflexus sp. TaxID=1969742 RepID=UPI0035E44492
MSWLRAQWPLVLAGLAAGFGLLGGLVWGLRPRTEAETAVLARRELQEAIRQLDRFLETYPAAPGEARGALQRAQSAFEKAAGHLALARPMDVQQGAADFRQLQALTAASAPPETILPIARQLRERLQSLVEE